MPSLPRRWKNADHEGCADQLHGDPGRSLTQEERANEQSEF